MKKLYINHKRKNPRKNNINELEIIDKNDIFKEVSKEEKRDINIQIIDENDIVREDSGSKFN